MVKILVVKCVVAKTKMWLKFAIQDKIEYRQICNIRHTLVDN